MSIWTIHQAARVGVFFCPIFFGEQNWHIQTFYEVYISLCTFPSSPEIPVPRRKVYSHGTFPKFPHAAGAGIGVSDAPALHCGAAVCRCAGRGCRAPGGLLFILFIVFILFVYPVGWSNPLCLCSHLGAGRNLTNSVSSFTPSCSALFFIHLPSCKWILSQKISTATKGKAGFHLKSKKYWPVQPPTLKHEGECWEENTFSWECTPNICYLNATTRRKSRMHWMLIRF